MSTLQPLHDEVEATTTVIGSAIALINGFLARLQAARASEDLSGEVGQLVDELETAKTGLAEAVAANTPAA